MGKPLGLLLLDARHQVVFANDEVLSALQPDQKGGCTNASTMQNLQNLITSFSTFANVPTRFTYAGRTWHSIRFRLPFGAEAGTMCALVVGSSKAPQSHAAIFGRMFRLTKRETEALELFIDGLSVKEAAAQMKISASTAKAFLRMISVKMGVSGRSEMMSNLLSHMCAASLTCPFRTSFPQKLVSSPKD